MNTGLCESDIIRPDWDAPANVHALVTTRQGGVSQAPFDDFNIAEHVGDNARHVLTNRQLLAQMLPSQPLWLNQVHSNRVVNASTATARCDADGSYSTQTNIIPVVMTADCLPVLICNRQGNGVAALHAGWRGLAGGILELGVEQLLAATQSEPHELLVWLGPAIGPEAFEVGEEVRQAFLALAAQQQSTGRDELYQALSYCFKPALKEMSISMSREKNVEKNIEKKWFADIYQLARVRLSLLGVENCSGGNYCTYNDQERFFSYRRDGTTGRMASLIWITDE